LKVSSPLESIRAALERVKDIEVRAERMDSFRMPLPQWAEESRALLPRLAKALELSLSFIGQHERAAGYHCEELGQQPDFCRTCEQIQPPPVNWPCQYEVALREIAETLEATE
jgi:hypothetical protein